MAFKPFKGLGKLMGKTAKGAFGIGGDSGGPEQAVTMTGFMKSDLDSFFMSGGSQSLQSVGNTDFGSLTPQQKTVKLAANVNPFGDVLKVHGEQPVGFSAEQLKMAAESFEARRQSLLAKKMTPGRSAFLMGSFS